MFGSVKIRGGAAAGGAAGGGAGHLENIVPPSPASDLVWAC